MNLLLLVASVLLIRAECAKILGVFPAPGYSQFILAEVLMKELANRGHEVTVISAYRPKEDLSNYRTILVEKVVRTVDDNLDLYTLGNANLFTQIASTYEFGLDITENTLQNKEVQKLLHSSDEDFHLVILEEFFMDALKGFAAHFHTPLVLLSSMGLTEWNKCYMEMPALPSFHAVMHTSHTNRMSFFERLKNIAGTIFHYWYRNFVIHPKHIEHMTKYFPKEMDFDKIVNNASLMLLNSHPTTSENVLLPYNIVEIGGFHVTSNPLDKAMQELLDSATDGAVLFSLGTNLRSSDLSQDTINEIFKVFGKMKQKIVWKFESDFPNKPANVYISKWLKQSDILAHPNVQLFITHGGLLGTTEAIFHGVPFVGIPFFGDQRMNVARAKSLGIATKISMTELAGETLEEAINEIINNPKYKNNIKNLSKLIQDRPLKPLDLAMYWIEHVIRHKGFRLETPGSNLYWFQLYMIDILCFVVFNLLVLYVVSKFVFTFVKKKLCQNVKHEQNIKKQKKKQQ